MRRFLFMVVAILCLTTRANAQTTVSANGPIAVSGGTVQMNPQGLAGITIQVTGTWTGTLNFEITTASTWADFSVTPSGGGSAVTTATANGLWTGTATALFVRARSSGVWTGTASVTLTAAAGGGGGGGNPFDQTLNTTSAPSFAGLFVSKTNPNILSDPNEHTAVAFKCVTNSLTTNTGFTNEECLSLTHTAVMGQNVYGGGTNAKRTFLGLKMTALGYGAGQHIPFSVNNYCVGMGDCFASNREITFSGGNIEGDEGVGWETSRIRQVDGPSTTIASVPAQTTCSTTITQAVTGSPTAQAVTVASTTNCVVNDWIVIGRQAPTGAPNQEALQITAVGGGAITGVWRNNHTSGATVTPGYVMVVTDPSNFGQDRVLVNLSASAYTTGTVDSYAGKTFTGAGTTWTNGMVGGDALNPGCIARTADDVGTIKSWYEIQSRASNTSIDVFSHTVALDTSYRGLSGSTAYTIRPCARILYLSNDAGSLSTTIVLNTNTFTWTAGQTIHVGVTPYPDVDGHFMKLTTYTPGGTYRAGYFLYNDGPRTFQCGFCLDVQPATQLAGYGYSNGFSAKGTNTGLYVETPISGYVSNGFTTAVTGSLVNRFVDGSNHTVVMGIDNATGDVMLGHEGTQNGKEVFVTYTGYHDGMSVLNGRTHLTLDSSYNDYGSPVLPTFKLMYGSYSITTDGSLVNGGRTLKWPNEDGTFALAIPGTTGSIGGGSLTNACTSGTATVTGATTTMALAVTPAAYPGDNVYWHAYRSNTNEVTVKVCTVGTVTPTATTYNVRAIQ